LIRLRLAAPALIVAMSVLLWGCGNDNQPFNDTPIITSFFPSSAIAGGQGFTLSLAGTGFSSSSVAYWNNSSRTTTFNSTSTQLSFPVTAQDIASPGTAQVVVVNPSPGGGPSTAVNFTIAPAQNPVPTIASLFPSITQVGVLPPGNLLAVNGTNFVSSSVVAFNGISRTTNFVGATQLTVPVTASDVASNATINVTVSNPSPGGGVSGSLAFKVGTGSSVRLKASVAAGVQFPQVVSVSAAGGSANGGSAAPAISSDGRFVAFYSTAANLVAQGGASGNVFVRDTCVGAANCTQQTIAVDLAPGGGAPNSAAESPVAISGDGRFVAFASSATNLVASDSTPAPSESNVYVRDLCTGLDAPSGCVPHTELVSIGANGDWAAGASNSPSLSFDGRFVAFVSAAGNLVAGLAASGNRVYVRDTCAGVVGLANCVPRTYSASPGMSDGLSAQIVADPVISAAGRYVAFDATNAPSASVANASVSQVFLADTCLGPNVPAACAPSGMQVSVSADGSLLAGLNQAPSIGADGRFVVFESTFPGAGPNVFLRDTCRSAATDCTPSTTLLMQNAAAPYLSPDGRYVSFIANPSGTPGSAVASAGSLYLYDTCFGAAGACTPQAYPVTASSLGPGSSPLTVNASSVPVTSDGSFLVFSTSASIFGLPLSGYGDVLFMSTAP